MFGLSSLAAGEAMFYISPQTLTIISGVLSAFSGLIWFIREGSGKSFATHERAFEQT
jgi:hypothetical protein